MHALEVTNLHVAYGSDFVLKGVTLSVYAGEWFCLLGPNGVGKSTLLHCLAGRLTPVRGDIRIAGACLTANPIDAKSALGYACAPDQLPGLLTGRQCLEVYALARQQSAIDADVLRLAEALRLGTYLDSYVDTYSLGTRQKLCVLLALLGQPRLIVLDEAFNGLDPRSSMILKRELQSRMKQGSAVLLATHSLDIVEHYADRAALMMEGRIVRIWSAMELTDLRAKGIDLEGELAAASEA
jgi:ABC-2 type transport system ATP-binding protein